MQALPVAKMLKFSRAAHGISAVEALITGPISDSYGATDITGRGVVLKMLKLGVKLLHNSGFGL